MLYVQQFQQTRQNHLKQCQKQSLAAEQNFVICSHEYAEKLLKSGSQPAPPSRLTTASFNREKARAVVVVTRVPSAADLNNDNTNNGVSVLNVVS